jgi:hypothetical protein
MPADPIFFAYYTPGPYEQEAERLRLSMDALTLRLELIPMAGRGSWQKNTQMKAEVVRDMLQRHPGERLVYLDVDAFCVVRPQLFWTIDADVAAVMYGGHTLLSGTVYLHSNERTVRLVDRWLELNKRYPERLPNGAEAWDQRTLQMAINQMPDVKFYKLPQEYTWIVELSQREYPESRPIICHTRGALRFQKQVNAEGVTA